MMINPCKETAPYVNYSEVISINEAIIKNNTLKQKTIIDTVKETIGDKYPIVIINYNLPSEYDLNKAHIQVVNYRCGYGIFVNPIVKNIKINFYTEKSI